MNAVVKQDGDFRNVDGFAAKVVQVVAEHLNQALVVGDICFGTVCEKRQSQGIDCKMPFDAVSAFVMTKSFRLDTGIARILHGLRVDN